MNNYFTLLTGGSNPGSLVTTIIMIALLVLVFYFFLYRPQKKQERQAADMRNSLEVGDEVTTIGGIIGQVASIKDETVLIETGKDKVRIRFLRSAIRSIDVHAYDKPGYKGAKRKEEAKAPAVESAKVKDELPAEPVNEAPETVDAPAAEETKAE